VIVNVNAPTFGRRFVDKLAEQLPRSDSHRGCRPAKSAEAIPSRDLAVIHGYTPFLMNSKKFLKVLKSNSARQAERRA
jgi:hypothetical protein